MAGTGREGYKSSLKPAALELSIAPCSWFQEGPQCRPQTSERSGTALPCNSRRGAAFLFPGEAGLWDADMDLQRLHMLAPSEDTADATVRRRGRGYGPGQGRCGHSLWQVRVGATRAGQGRAGQVSPLLPCTPAPVGACLTCLAQLVLFPALWGVLVQPGRPLASLASALAL